MLCAPFKGETSFGESIGSTYEAVLNSRITFKTKVNTVQNDRFRHCEFVVPLHQLLQTLEILLLSTAYSSHQFIVSTIHIISNQ